MVNMSDLLKSDIGKALVILENAGFDKGDFFPLYTFNPLNSQSVSFTNTAYDFDHNLSLARVVWNHLFPGDVTDTQVMGAAYLNPGTGETLSVRIRNGGVETVVEKTGITSAGQVQLGPVDYTPGDLTSYRNFRWEWKTDTGTNSSFISAPYIVFGVML